MWAFFNLTAYFSSHTHFTTVYEYSLTCCARKFSAQSTYIGRDETGSVYLPTQLERTLQLYWWCKCKERGWACTPHPHQPWPILPSSLNVRQKAAVATLCTLWFCGSVYNKRLVLWAVLRKEIERACGGTYNLSNSAGCKLLTAFAISNRSS
jgi:hypothetical protein